jgi:hypothetical protein
LIPTLVKNGKEYNTEREKSQLLGTTLESIFTLNNLKDKTTDLEVPKKSLNFSTQKKLQTLNQLPFLNSKKQLVKQEKDQPQDLTKYLTLC